MSEKRADDIHDLIRQWRFTAICESCNANHELEPDDIFLGTLSQASREAQRRAHPLDDEGHVLIRVDYESMGVVDMAPPQVTHHCPHCEAAARERDVAYEDSRQMQERLQRLIDAEPQRELAALREQIEAIENIAFAGGAMEQAPCFICGYNGRNYYQPETHPCAERHHRYMGHMKKSVSELRTLLAEKEAK